MLEEAHKLSQQNPELGKRIADYAVIVEKAAEYCHHLSENWRLASKKVSDFTQIDLVAIAHEVKQVIFFGNSAVKVTGADNALIRGSRFEIMRVFQNLLKNSIEAGGAKGGAAFLSGGGKGLVTKKEKGPRGGEEPGPERKGKRLTT